MPLIFRPPIALPPAAPNLTFPAIDQTLHIIPRDEIPAAKVQAYKDWRATKPPELARPRVLYAIAQQAQKAGDDEKYKSLLIAATRADEKALQTAEGNPFNARETAEYIRRKEQALSIQTSDIPGWRRAWAQAETQLDNYEDLISSLHGIGRVALTALPQLEMGIRVLGILKELINAPVTLSRAGMPGNLRKILMLVNQLRDPKQWLTNLVKPATAIKGLPGIGVLAEIAQTTDWFFGVGLQLGPLIGWAENIIWTAGKGAYKAVATGDLSYATRAGVRILSAGASIFRKQDTSPQLLKIERLLTQAFAMQQVKTTSDAVRSQLAIQPDRVRPGFETLPPTFTDPATQQIITDLEEFFPVENVWPVPGNPGSWDPTGDTFDMAAEARFWLTDLIADTDGGPYHGLPGILATQITHDLWDLATGTDGSLATRPGPALNAQMQLGYRGYAIDRYTTERDLEEFYADLGATHATGPHLDLTDREITAAAAKHGITFKKE